MDRAAGLMATSLARPRRCYSESALLGAKLFSWMANDDTRSSLLLALARPAKSLHVCTCRKVGGSSCSASDCSSHSLSSFWTVSLNLSLLNLSLCARKGESWQEDAASLFKPSFFTVLTSETSRFRSSCSGGVLYGDLTTSSIDAQARSLKTGRQP